ncbi:MAG: FAD-binding oxidoreductase [Hyphomicrobiaceae bacterium]
MTSDSSDIVIIGAGIAGLAVGYYAARRLPGRRIDIIDMGAPMALTSAQSGENYRNWWPHQVMTAFTDHSISLMEEIARATGNRINMTRRGYLLATRQPHPAELIEQLHAGYGASAAESIRIHDRSRAVGYQPPVSADWQDTPTGVDVLLDRDLIHKTFPSLDPEIACILHIRRAGDISGQQLGQYMIETIREAGGRIVRGRVKAVSRKRRIVLECEGPAGLFTLDADQMVNAAGPFARQVAAMLGETLPVTTVLQQKITFPDRAHAIPRSMPFAIDLDTQTIDWSEDERAALADDPSNYWLIAPMPGGIHCRPEGGEHGEWIKLGWAYNAEPSEPAQHPDFDVRFPEIVLRGAARLNPTLKSYYGRLPRERVLYGGYYTMTSENWPLIGPMQTEGAFIAGALSGFGTMAACAAGDLMSRWLADDVMPGFARSLAPQRYRDKALMAQLASLGKGTL